MQYRFPLLLVVLVFCAGLCAQAAQTGQPSPNGSIKLLVTDISGGIVPNADVGIDPLPVILKNLTTNQDGILSLDLPPGTYDLTVKSQGFRTERKHVQIDAGASQNLTIALMPGGCTECVTVTEVSPASTLPLKEAPTDLRIQVLDGRNGHSLSNICLNISLGMWHGADLLAPANGDGIATLHVAAGVVSADIPRDSQCVGGFPTQAALPRGEDRITPASGGNDCHPKHQSPVPLSYSIQEILEHGIVGENVCGKIKVEARPGQLFLFVRPSPWYARPFL